MTFAVTKGARRAANTIGGTLDSKVKAYANRRNRRRANAEVRTRGADADVTIRHYTDWDVI